MPQSLLGEAQALGLAGAFLIFGCGPNVQLIYEGNVRFEHCYRLDLDSSISPPHRKACWKDYLARHTYAQTGDRLSYARQRLNDLENGKQSTLALSLDGGAAAAPRADAVPLPSNIHAAPPPRALEQPAASSQTVLPVQTKKVVSPINADCSEACTSRWNECSPNCDFEGSSAGSGDAGSKPSTAVSEPSKQNNQKVGCVDCKKAFKVCMQRCYR